MGGTQFHFLGDDSILNLPWGHTTPKNQYPQKINIWIVGAFLRWKVVVQTLSQCFVRTLSRCLIQALSRFLVHTLNQCHVHTLSRCLVHTLSQCLVHTLSRWAIYAEYYNASDHKHCRSYKLRVFDYTEAAAPAAEVRVSRKLGRVLSTIS